MDNADIFSSGVKENPGKYRPGNLTLDVSVYHGELLNVSLKESPG